jgi:hypothetical protein
MPTSEDSFSGSVHQLSTIVFHKFLPGPSVLMNEVWKITGSEKIT